MGGPETLRWRLKAMEEVSSTQSVALRMAERGAPEGTVVTARRQTAGRGRTGRSWASPDGGLYMSIVLRRAVQSKSQLLSLIGALAVVRGIESETGLKSSIRWPNDVLLRGRKVAGVLSEASFSGQTLSFVVLGIGLNCNSRASSLDALGDSATSLMEESGRRVDLDAIRRSVLESLGGVHEGWLDGLDVVRAVKAAMGTLGRSVTARTKSGVELSFSALDLDSSGGLVVIRAGEKSVLRAEDLEWLRETGP